MEDIGGWEMRDDPAIGLGSSPDPDRFYRLFHRRAFGRVSGRVFPGIGGNWWPGYSRVPDSPKGCPRVLGIDSLAVQKKSCISNIDNTNQ